jgi:hypothetical protein
MEKQKASQEVPARVRWDLVSVRAREEGGVLYPLIAPKYPDVTVDLLIDAARDQSRALRNLNLHRALGGKTECSAVPYHECRVFVSHDGVDFAVHHLMTPAQALRAYVRERQSARLRAELARRARMNRELRVVVGGYRSSGGSAPFSGMAGTVTGMACLSVARIQPLQSRL